MGKHTYTLYLVRPSLFDLASFFVPLLGLSACETDSTDVYYYIRYINVFPHRYVSSLFVCFYVLLILVYFCLISSGHVNSDVM